MHVIRCPKCWGPLQVAPDVAGKTRPCPLCGASIQLASEHKPIPAHRLHGWQQRDSWLIDGRAANWLGIAMLCGCVLLGGWMAVMFLPRGSSSGSMAANSVPIELRHDAYGITGRVTNNSGVALSRVAVNVRVIEYGKATPIIKSVYHLEPAGGIASGETVDCQVFWRKEDSRAYATAKGYFAVKAEVSALISAEGESLYLVPP